MTDEEYAEVQRLAQAAKSVLESEPWTRVVARLKTEIGDAWTFSAWADQVGREQRFAEIKGLEMIQARLQTWISNAKIEADRRERARLKAE